jgi:hypothetical protein
MYQPSLVSEARLHCLGSALLSPPGAAGPGVRASPCIFPLPLAAVAQVHAACRPAGTISIRPGTGCHTSLISEISEQSTSALPHPHATGPFPRTIVWNGSSLRDPRRSRHDPLTAGRHRQRGVCPVRPKPHHRSARPVSILRSALSSRASKPDLPFQEGMLRSRCPLLCEKGGLGALALPSCIAERFRCDDHARVGERRPLLLHDAPASGSD